MTVQRLFEESLEPKEVITKNNILLNNYESFLLKLNFLTFMLNTLNQ